MTNTPANTKALREELERLGKEATPGEWIVSGGRKYDGKMAVSFVETLGGDQIADLYHAPHGADLRPFPNDRENARLIVALRNSLPEILSALRVVEVMPTVRLSAKARERVEEYAEACETMKDTRALASDLRTLLSMDRALAALQPQDAPKGKEPK